MQNTETKKNSTLKIKNILNNYKAPILVLSLIGGAVIFDYAFRNSSNDYYSKGILAMQSQKFDDAIKAFSRALRQNPADGNSRFGLAWAYHSKGWLDEALKQYDSASKAAVDAAYLSNFNSGVIYQQKRRLDEALNSYQTAIGINPKGFGAVFNLGFIYADRGQNDLALQQFVRASKLETRNAMTYYNAGLISERLGKKEDAKKWYQTALSIDMNLSGAKERLKALGG